MRENVSTSAAHAHPSFRLVRLPVVRPICQVLTKLLTPVPKKTNVLHMDMPPMLHTIMKRLSSSNGDKDAGDSAAQGSKKTGRRNKKQPLTETEATVHAANVGADDDAAVIRRDERFEFGVAMPNAERGKKPKRMTKEERLQDALKRADAIVMKDDEDDMPKDLSRISKGHHQQQQRAHRRRSSAPEPVVAVESVLYEDVDDNDAMPIEEIDDEFLDLEGSGGGGAGSRHSAASSSVSGVVRASAAVASSQRRAAPGRGKPNEHGF